MPDGEIIINTKLDDKQAQTELNRLTIKNPKDAAVA